MTSAHGVYACWRCDPPVFVETEEADTVACPDCGCAMARERHAVVHDTGERGNGDVA